MYIYFSGVCNVQLSPLFFPIIYLIQLKLNNFKVKAMEDNSPFSPPQLLGTAHLLSVSVIWTLNTSHKWNHVNLPFLSDGLVSDTTISSRFIHIIETTRVSFLNAAQYSIALQCYSMLRIPCLSHFLMWTPGLLHVLAVVRNTAMSMLYKIVFKILLSILLKKMSRRDSINPLLIVFLHF